MILKNLDELKEIRERNIGKKIVFCSGVFDLTHAGHVLFFEDCKKLGDILVVLTGDDDGIRTYKGESRPILNQHVRLKMIDSLKPVNYCFLGGTPKNDLLGFVKVVLKILKPDIIAINNDAFEIESRKKMADEFGISLCILKRWCPDEFENISTSSIIKKIKNFKE